MRMLIREKDYMPDGAGGFLPCSEDKRLGEEVVFLLTARRGGFSPMPEVGSRLYLLPFEKPSRRQVAAEAYVQEALEGLGLTILGVDVTAGEMMTVEVRLRAGATEQVLEVYIQ